MASQDHDLDEALFRFAETPRPFELLRVRYDEGQVKVFVHIDDLETARRYFHLTPVQLSNGLRPEIEVAGSACEGWYAFPDGTPAESRLDVARYVGPVEPEHINLSQLVGMNVGDAADLATASGWLVRAVQPGVPLTADNPSNRLTLVYGMDEVVVSADRP